MIPRNSIRVIPHHQRGLDRQVHDHQPLGSQLIRQDLQGVRDQEARPRQGVEDVEHPDEDDLRVPGRLDIARLFELRGRDGPRHEHEHHAGRGGQEEGTTTDSVDEEGTADGHDEGEHGLAGVEGDALVLRHDAHARVDSAHVVGEEGVAGVLGDDTEGDEDGETVSVALGAEEVHVGGGLLELKFETERFSDLTVFEADCCIRLVSVCVVFGEDVFGFFVSLLADQPTWRFWDPF